ncbi:MAG: hypothetical protein IIT83_09415 [Bacteroidales bacterium]|jgi:uncharacterized membrane protein|nr:hypothetical protein [Bacteroidales bacterium]MBQ5575889.1 hypothetical protein [Bacteroidales bacterium]
MAEETQNTSNGGNTFMKVLSYLGILWLIPFFAVKGVDRNASIICHLKQGFGAVLIEVVGYIISTMGMTMIGGLVSLCGLILALIGIINAVQGNDKELPILGSFFTSSFSFIK